jgi:mRNA interferase HicA
MTGAEFVRRLRRLGRERGVAVRIDPGHGKGSHGRVFFGRRSTTIPHLKREIGVGLLRALCRQLGIGVDDVRKG